ncbi:MAG: hypothetical protein ACI4QX_09745 [Lachnospiraceae bacterium]
MEKATIQARKDLLAGREPEKNLPRYLKGLAGGYYRMANYNLAMQYTAFTEAVRDGELKLTDRTKKHATLVKQLVETLLSDRMVPEDFERPLQELNDMRGEISAAMEVLTAYTDKLYLYEYVLRRLAPAMEDTVEDVDSYAALEEMSGYLFCEEEQELLLERLSRVVSELPVRMTKGKFMEWVRSAASVYKESDAESLNRAFYMLYSASGLYEPEGMEEFPEYGEALQYFSSLDYRSLTEEQYREAKTKLEAVTESIGALTEVYLSLIDLVNSLMMLFLTAPYVMPEDLKKAEACMEVFRLLMREELYSEDEIAEAFAAFEGAPEVLEESLFREETYLEELPVSEELISAMMQKVLYTRIVYAKRLHTSSMFVSLEEEQNVCEFEEALNKFCERLSETLENGQRAVNRAVMAQVIHTLPLPFTKKSEVQK